MKEERSPERRKTGRPLSFDREAALQSAMHAFWRHGYETTSIAVLTAAMGVTAPSIYSAFGDKKRLFLEAVRRYAGEVADIGDRFDRAPTARDAAVVMLRGSVIGFTGAGTPRGCLLASATASGSAASADVQAAVAEVRRGIADRLRRRVERDIAAALLPADTDAAALADLMISIVQGLSVLARDGLSRAHLLAVAEQAIRCWPDQVRPST